MVGVAAVNPQLNPRTIEKRRSTFLKSGSDLLECGGAEGNRTPDLFHAMEALYQLSYSPAKHGDSTSDPFGHKAR
jgi:hypothetical protein